MKLISLKLTNFKGVKSFELIANRQSVSVYGDNGTGKTTLADAQAWLLFDKDSTGTKNFNPKAKGSDGNDMHNTDNTVEGIYELESGEQISFKKIFSEIWKKKRGSSDSEFSGHTTDYFIDSVPAKETEYNARVSTLSKIEIQTLSSTSFFASELPTTERRKTLISIVGDVSDFDVAESDPELKDLWIYLAKPQATGQYYTVDDYKAIAKAKLSECNKQLEEIPKRIDEAILAAGEQDNDDYDLEIKKLESELKVLNLKLSSTDTQKINELNSELTAIRTQMQGAKIAHSNAEFEANKGINAKVINLNKDFVALEQEVGALKYAKKQLEAELSDTEKAREKLLAEHLETSKKTWSGDMICPTCGQDMPLEQIEASKEKFNLNRSNKLEEINEIGKETCSKEKISEIKVKIASLENSISETETKSAAVLKESLSVAEQKTSGVIFEETKIFYDFKDKMEAVENQIKNFEAGNKESKSLIISEISDVESRIKQAYTKHAKKATRVVQLARVEELEKQQVDISTEYGKLQKGVYLCELFTKTKVNMLSDTINSKFKNIRFRLFQDQINGGIKDDCEPVVPSMNGLIPFQYANNAARINGGLDIIRVMQEHYKFALPVFVDNAESVTRINSDGLQVIRLVVSEADKRLRVEN